MNKVFLQPKNKKEIIKLINTENDDDKYLKSDF